MNAAKKRWTKAQDAYFDTDMTLEQIMAATGRTYDECARRSAYLEQLAMSAWCAPGESVQDMLERAAERD